MRLKAYFDDKEYYFIYAGREGYEFNKLFEPNKTIKLNAGLNILVTLVKLVANAQYLGLGYLRK